MRDKAGGDAGVDVGEMSIYPWPTEGRSPEMIAVNELAWKERERSRRDFVHLREDVNRITEVTQPMYWTMRALGLIR